jgi:dipeptidyl aminopeptidase/acylaminoacyl peptidase
MALPLTPETLVYDLPAASDPQVSPDGTRIVYTLTTVDAATKQPRSHLWLCAIDGGEPCQLTQTGTRNAGAR